MDRQLIYTGQLPLTTDLLNTNLYGMWGLGRLAMDVLGTSTVVSGLAATPTSPASMSVNIGAGALYSLQNIDNAAYSSIPANTTDQILKQGILKTSDAFSLTMTAPATAGYSVIYLIEASYEDLDTGNAVLNYYNSANPSVPYTGPNNNNAAQPTLRGGRISIQAKAGIAAASPSPPSVDAGYVPLYYVTVAYGQTSITSGNIAIASGAPFLSGNLSSLGSYLTSAAAASTYAPLSGFGSTLATSGYQKLPSGLIIQWGFPTSSSTANAALAVNFPIAFPNAFHGVTASANNASTTPTNAWTDTVTNTGFNLHCNVASIGCYYIATGH